LKTNWLITRYIIIFGGERHGRKGNRLVTESCIP